MSHSPQSAERLPSVPARRSGPPTSSNVSQIDTPVLRHGGPQSRGTHALPSLAVLTGEAEGHREHGTLGSPTPSRSLGVRSILNPAAEAQTAQAQHVPSSPHTSASSAHHGQHPAPHASPHIRKRGEPHSPAPAAEMQVSQAGRTGRKILTPRSPSLNSLRAASIGTHRSPSMGPGSISRVPLPTGEGRGYTAEPGDSRDSVVPPLPPLSAATRAALPSMQPREMMSPAMHTSPPTSGQPYPSVGPPTLPHENRREQARPPFASAEPPSSNFQQNPPHPQTGASEEHMNAYGTPTPGPVRSSLTYGQTEYQLMFETQQGSMVVPLNVDYQQASRLADEKRKRNAGASARFRARRKEKEREANQTIAGLQQELQEMMDEREFYLRERNFYRDFVVRTTSGPLPTRPRSPQAHRSHPATSASADPGPNTNYGRQEVEASAAQRRRTGDYQPSLTSQSPGSSYNVPYPSSGPAMTLPAPASGSFSDPRTGNSGQAPPPPPATRPPPFDTLRRSGPEREWTSGR